MTIQQENGVFRNGVVTGHQKLTLDRAVYSIADLFTLLNPTHSSYGDFPVRFSASADGSIQIGIPYSKKEKKVAEQSLEAANKISSVCTDVLLSEPLLTYLDMTDSKIIRKRKNRYLGHEVSSVGDWFLKLYEKWDILSSYECDSERTWTASDPSQDRISDDYYTGDAALDASNSLDIVLPNGWVDANFGSSNAAQRQALNLQNFNGSNYEIGLVIRQATDSTVVVHARSWTFFWDGAWMLRVSGMLNQTYNEGDGLILEDPILKTGASIFQKIINPALEIDQSQSIEVDGSTFTDITGKHWIDAPILPDNFSTDGVGQFVLIPGFTETFKADGTAVWVFDHPALTATKNGRFFVKVSDISNDDDETVFGVSEVEPVQGDVSSGGTNPSYWDEDQDREEGDVQDLDKIAVYSNFHTQTGHEALVGPGYFTTYFLVFVQDTLESRNLADSHQDTYIRPRDKRRLIFECLTSLEDWSKPDSENPEDLKTDWDDPTAKKNAIFNAKMQITSLKKYLIEHPQIATRVREALENGLADYKASLYTAQQNLHVADDGTAQPEFYHTSSYYFSPEVHVDQAWIDHVQIGSKRNIVSATAFLFPEITEEYFGVGRRNIKTGVVENTNGRPELHFKVTMANSPNDEFAFLRATGTQAIDVSRDNIDIVFRQVNKPWFSAKIIEFEEEKGGDDELQCMMIWGSEKQERDFITDFPTITTGNVDRAKDAVEFYFRGHESSVRGQIFDEGLKYEKPTIVENNVVKSVSFRMRTGDYLKSSRPCADSISAWTSCALTSSDGLIFKPQQDMGFEAPVLLSVSIDNPYALSCDKNFSVGGLSIVPRGDTYWSSGNRPLMHQLTVGASLRSLSIKLELLARDGTENITAELAPRGRFEVLLLFTKLK